MTSPAVPGTSPVGPASASDPGSAPRFFPKGFLWGAATAAYQVEGASDVDGRALSIWDTFSHTPGRVPDGATGDVACDHYHRLEADLDLLGWLGVSAYRFSVSWPRWMPRGHGRRPARGADFYDRLVDGLLERGIQPWATLYHWDLPQSLQDAGGWARRDTAHRFADYADSVGERLGDRVRGFFTLDEPWCSAFLGYAAGVHAPGVQDDAAAIRAVHHLLLGHGEAVTALRLRGTRARLGIALNVHPVDPLTRHPEDLEAARRIDGLANRVFLDPLLLGDYPVDVVADLSDITDFSHIHDGDLRVIGSSLDVLGINYHGPHVVAAPGTASARAQRVGAESHEPWAPAAPDGRHPRSPWVGARDVVFAAAHPAATGIGSEAGAGAGGDAPAPQGLPDVLLRLVFDYDCPPLVVTGAGAPFPDAVDSSGDRTTVADLGRLAHLEHQLDACLEALAEGVDLRGYFVGSLLDGFEWAWGFSRRFGIVHVDRETGRRTPKESARYLRAVAGDNALRGR